MWKFICLLSVVLAPAASQSVFGPFHGTADDYANVYWTSSIPGGPYLNKLNSEVLDNWQHSYPLASFPKPSAQHMIVAASNKGTWEGGNPAGILLSSDPGATQRIVSDKSWRCNGYPDIPGVSRKQWSSSENVKTIIEQAIGDKSQQSWLPAVEINPNFVFGNWAIRDKIPLGAFWIWADGLDEEKELPPANVICIKGLNFK
jgi:hypothetical protein